ncbi:hypothetical protein R3P38DRAFT_3070346 [Favolaschia claudopus]|uniref:Uncharacterized protein n=1 Tax=Favolaschia claudopus TaxID=2862362 RepID=A0AAW0A097_9AGAR
MPAMRMRPTGFMEIKTTKGKAYLLNETRSLSINIHTELKRFASASAAKQAAIKAYGHGFQIAKLPYLAVERVFTAAANTEIHDCVVTINKKRFFICAFYNAQLPVNLALKKITPGFNWRGEIVVVPLGKDTRFICQSKVVDLKAAVNKFQSVFLTDLHMEKKLPISITCD